MDENMTPNGGTPVTPEIPETPETPAAPETPVNQAAQQEAAAQTQVTPVAPTPQAQQSYEQQTYSQPNYNQTSYTQQTYTQQTYQEEVQPGKGFAIAGMVCGIVSLLLACCFWPLAIVTAIVGLVLSIIGLRKKQSKGMSIAGIITSALGILASLVMVLFLQVFVASLNDAIQDPAFRERLEQDWDSEDMTEEQRDLVKDIEDALDSL